MRAKTKSVPAENRSVAETARRAQIVGCAIDTIAEVGFGKASVDQIAKRAGVSKGVITYHFPNKEEIVDAIIEKVVAAGRTYMEPRIMAETSAAGRLRAYIESDLEFIDAYRKPLIALVEIAMSARRADGSLRRLESVQNAVEQGKAVAAAVLDKKKPFLATPLKYV